MAEQETAAPPDAGGDDPLKKWDETDAGLKSRAMRNVHEEQQKLVVDLGRQIMDKQAEIAMAKARARAAAGLSRTEEVQRIVTEELRPLEREREELAERVRGERELLDEYERLGKGLI